MAVLIPFWTLCSCCLLFWATADWVVQLSSAGEDTVGGVAVDSAANPIVAVSSTSAVVSGLTLVGREDIFVLKYNADGTLQSQWSFGTPETDVASSIIVDSSDNIFVAGTTNGTWPGQSQSNPLGHQQIVLFKLNSAGFQQWAVQVDINSIINAHSVSCVALDSAQNVILGGMTVGDLPGFTNAGLYDFFIFKFDSTGSQLWAFQIGTSLYDIAGGLAVDSSDNIIMCGFGMVGSGYGYATSGNTGVAFDGNTVFGDSDIFVFKLTSTGSKAWSDQIGGSGADEASDVAVDSSDNFYVTGKVTDLVGGTGQGEPDACVIKYDTNGVRQWVKQIGTAFRDEGDQIVIVSDTLYVSGATYGDFHGTNAGGADYFVVRMDTAGNEISGEQYGTDKDEFRGFHFLGGSSKTTLTHDASSNIYAMGTVWDLSGTSYDAFLWKTKVDTTTTTTTTTTTSTTTTTTTTTTSITINTDSTTADWVLELSSAGEDTVGGVAVDSAANPIVAVSSTSAVVSGLTLVGREDIFVLKYNADGTLQSQWSFGTPETDVASSIIVDSSDNIFVAGTTNGTWPGQSQSNPLGHQQIVLFKLNSAGFQQWAVQVDINSIINAHSVSCVALDSAQNVILGGMTVGDLPGFTNAGLYDFFIFKFDSTGSQLWAFQIGTSLYDIAGGLAVDSSDNIIMCGFGMVGSGYGYATSGNTGVAFDGNTVFGDSDIFVFKLTSTGSKAWSDQIGGSGADEASDVPVDSSDNFYVTGKVTGQLVGATSQGGTDACVIKYDTNGVRQWVKQIGTASDDGGDQIVIVSDTVYVSGPTSGDFHGTNAGGVDYFVVRMDTAGNEISGEQYGTDKDEFRGFNFFGGSSRTTLTHDASSNIYAMGTVWDDAFLWKTKIDTTTTTTPSASTTSSEAEEQVLVSAEEVEALETQRKEQAAAAVAAVDAAIDAAVQQALIELFSGNGDTSNPGVLGQVSVQSPVGPVKVAAFSQAKLAAAGGVATVSAGDGNESAGAGASATLEVNSALLGEVGGSVLLSASVCLLRFCLWFGSYLNAGINMNKLN